MPCAPPRRAVARKTPDTFPVGSVAYKLHRLLERKRKGREDQQIAEVAGMTPAMFSKFLTGRAENPSLKSLRKVLAAIGATLCEFDRA